ncbi:MAG: hypothetical protein EBS56_12035 [Planctomycetia bacterium]|nr:hypothetical protein [Planctomycetia bacterium]
MPQAIFVRIQLVFRSNCSGSAPKMKIPPMMFCELVPDACSAPLLSCTIVCGEIGWLGIR